MASKARMRLTDAGIARLRPRESKYTVLDTRTPGLGVRVRPSGGTSFLLFRKTDGRSTRLSLGSVASRNVDDVRRQCHALMATPDPEHRTKRTCKVPLFRDFVARPWKESHFPRYKPSTRNGVNTVLTSQLVPAFGSTPLDRITPNDVLHWFDAYSQTAPGGANHALRILRKILEFAIARGHISINPASDVTMNQRTALTRVLSRDELRRLHRALDQHARTDTRRILQADIILLLLLTGCRRGEIFALPWNEVDGDATDIGDTTTGPRKVYLNAQARRIIERQPSGRSAFVFPSPRNPERPYDPDLPLWDGVREEAGIEDVRLHDLPQLSPDPSYSGFNSGSWRRAGSMVYRFRNNHKQFRNASTSSSGRYRTGGSICGTGLELSGGEGARRVRALARKWRSNCRAVVASPRRTHRGPRVSRNASMRGSSSVSTPRSWCWSQRLRLLTSRSLLTADGRAYPCALS